jgi:hypothetical protein
MDATHEENREAIADRAYAIYLERAREGTAGDELSDWYAAEQEILAKEALAPKRKKRSGH